MIILVLSVFDIHVQGKWILMYPGLASRDYAQTLQVENGIIPQNDYTTWQTWQRASSIQYLDVDNPQQSFQEGETITQLVTGASGIILTDDGVTITFHDSGTGTWNTLNNFFGVSSGSKGQIDTYTPGAAVLPPNASLLGSGAIPQHAWITNAAGTDLGAIMFCPNSYTVGLSGLGGFLNPDYQNMGDYSGINGLTHVGTYLGNWIYPPSTVGIGDIVFNAGVDEKFYVNLTPGIGLAPYYGNSLTDGSSIIGNMLSAGSFIYDNILTTGSSINNNEDFEASISSNILNNGGISLNTLKVGSSIMGNTVENDSTIYFNSLNEHSNIRQNYVNGAGAAISDNVFNNYVLIYKNTLNGLSLITQNFFTQNSSAVTSLQNKTFPNGISFSNNIVGVNIDQTETYSYPGTGIQSKRAESGFSNFETTLTLLPSPPNPPNTIDVSVVGYCGIINFSGTGSLTLDTITNLSAFTAIQFFRIKPVSGITLTINNSGNITLLASAGTSITLNGSSSDYCDFWTDGSTAFQNSPANNY